ncbi:MAG TPA: type VI secretion system protein, partial [Anaeromyxobacteraceae bacterium]|nr:type VI secretion system protein [Anaeromyxobacteraceae bacterium]
AAAAPAPAGRVSDACEVRFGMKSGANAFFHLRPLGGDRFASALAGEVRLEPGDARPILRTLKEAEAPERFATRAALFRPERLGPRAAAYVARGEAAGVHLRPTCAGRSPWWHVAPGRSPAPVLYPAKVGARAFAVVNAAGVWEDKKWHALFPRGELPPWLLALALSATPVRLAVDLAARQLTGAQAIADVDCRVLAAAHFPAPRALARLGRRLAPCRAALARDPVTTDLAAVLARPAQRELDRVVGEAMGLGGRAVEAARRDLLERVGARLAHAGDVRRRLAAG